MARFESNRDVEQVYDEALRELDRKIAAHVERLAALKVERRTADDPAGYDTLIGQAEQLLVEMRANRRTLEHERLTAPAARAVADAAVRVADDASGLGATASSQALASVRDQVDALQRRAHPGLLDADGVPIHARRAALDARAREDRAREELERLKEELKKKK